MSQTYCNVCTADCPASCRLLTDVVDGRIINIKGDPRDPYTQGKICAKGYALKELVYSPNRVLYPLKQQRKGSGNWQRISWEQAFLEIGNNLVKIDQEYGSLLPVSMNKFLGTTGLLSQSVEGFFGSLGPITMILGNPCVSAGTDAFILNYGALKKPFPEDMKNSRLILIWGANPAWTTIHQMRYIFEAQDQGAIIVVIDPIFTSTAARSDMYYRIRPGTDGDLALGLAKILVEENLVDHEFLNNFTFGWPEYRDYLETVDLNTVSSSTGIPIPELYELARLYGTIKPATIRLGPGIQRGPSGGQNARIIDSLTALTGNIGISGGNVHYTSYEQLLHAGKYGKLRLPYGVRQGLTENKIDHRILGTDWYTHLDTLDPPLKFLWVAGRNPVAQDPDSAQIIQAMKTIDTVVVADQTLSATAQMADYVLPVSSPFEFEDVVISLWHYGAAINQQAIPPLGESKSDFEIMHGLASVLHQLKPGLSSFPLHGDPRTWLTQEFTSLNDSLGISDYRELAHHPARVNLPAVPWQDRQFPTASGCYEFFSHTAALHRAPPLPIPVDQPVSSHPYPFRLMVARSPLTLNSQFYNIDLLRRLENAPLLLIHPDTGRQKNLAEGDLAKVYNEMGELELPVSFSLSLPPDIVITYMGMEDLNNTLINTLLSFESTDLGQIFSGSHGIAYNNCFVNLVKMG
ncbi:MAG TPA: molybdopterin-dependent oxidoreductase [Desulfitobacterium dehalogenans]|uniref:Molybdopterin-dependent oxidoreductase n=1 Tax=Desulfitobacterium dehalogenans TaxID=36854 RepID=A0A7C6Z267_9FIRM|nr:molybdopterin-dependent oxidoreductase [Desulfitobacterium dehalogenans]